MSSKAPATSATHGSCLKAHASRIDVIAHVKKNETLSSNTYFTVPCYIGRSWLTYLAYVSEE